MRFCKHPDIETPRGNYIVWRYMGLDKFLDLITFRRLYFANAGSFTDKNEMSLPPKFVKYLRGKLEEEGTYVDSIEEEMARFERFSSTIRDSTLVNCWILGRSESYALWKIYLGGSNAGVAIRTTLSRVRNSIILAAEASPKDSYPEDIYVGRVQYGDFPSGSDINKFQLVTTKREFYKYEDELRFFILHNPLSDGDKKPPYSVSDGRHVAVDLDTLIDEIYLSPFAAPWFGDAMKSVMKSISPKMASRITNSSIRDR